MPVVIVPTSSYQQQHQPPFPTVTKSTFTFRSDITFDTPTQRDAHPRGILHATKKENSPVAGYTSNNNTNTNNKSGNGRVEHAFVWLDNKFHGRGVTAVIEQLIHYGFGLGSMVFIPYTDLENWTYRYPHACKFTCLLL